ncbi:mitochondrial 54S ribosomal protein mL58 [Limtongia smithiae]|uniref:mitochondrial 54S ribosomal protein mL58 n=1 Tax=Limtongia smithiae TaxID=1125753 RepID=UPI0034CD3C53
MASRGLPFPSCVMQRSERSLCRVALRATQQHTRTFSSTSANLADPNPNKVARTKDPKKYRTPFPTRFNPQSSANTARPIYPPGLTYNPPPSTSSPYETPDIFLPMDKRIAIDRAESLSYLPPPLRTIQEKTYHLTEENIAELRRLRYEDPAKWTRSKLGEKFGCSPFFAGMAAELPPDQLREQLKGKVKEQKKWGLYKRNARLQREKKKEGWRQDD